MKHDITQLQKALDVSHLSVSDVYPDDDGSLRRMVDVQVNEHDTLSAMRILCNKIASQFDGRFMGAMRIAGNTLTFVILYDMHVDPPSPWKVFREDPL